MKNYLYGIFAIAFLAFTACTNEELPTPGTGPGHPCRAQVGGDTRQIFALRERDTRQDGRSDPQRRPRHPLGHPFGRRGTRHRGRLPDRARLPRRRPQRGAHPRIGAAPVVRRTLRRRLLRRGGRRETFGPGRSPAREPQPHDPPCLQRRQEGDAPHPRGPRRHAACDPVPPGIRAIPSTTSCCRCSGT